MNKPCLILDLDETVISTLTQSEINRCMKNNARDDYDFLKANLELGDSDKNKLHKYDWHYDAIPPPPYTHKPTKGSFVTFERPGLQEFLDFAFENFRVFIWTAGSPEYAVTLTENIILRRNLDKRKVHGVFNSYHVDLATRVHGPMKDLKLLWETFNNTLPEGSRCTEYDTIIMDDNPLVHDPYPSNCLYTKALEMDKPRMAAKDTFLKTIQLQLTALLQMRAGEVKPMETAELLMKSVPNLEGKSLDEVTKRLDTNRPLSVEVLNFLNGMTD